MNFRALICFFFLLNPLTALSDWTGVIVKLEDTDTSWLVRDQSQESSVNRLSLEMEEKTAAELRVGISIGQVSIRTKGISGIDRIEKFEGNYFGLYLRQPVHLNNYLSFEGSLGYRLHTGMGQIESDADEIEWHETNLMLSIGLYIADIRVSPFVQWKKVDGDVSGEEGRNVFETDEARSQGLMLDYFIDPFSYIRLQFSEGGNESLQISFAKVY
ncbi:MAG: hypothetical protein ACI845_000586 [Gammaproteobacteria bacterium]